MGENTANKNIVYWIHIIVTVTIMIGFGYLPAPDPITPFGMKILGIFLGMIYGWSTVDQIYPSLFGLVMLALVDYSTFDSVLIAGWGTSTVWSTILIMTFAQALTSAGITECLSISLMNHKLFFGRPWIFTGAILFVSFLVSSVTNPFVAMLIFWSIVYDISKEVGFKPGDLWPSMTIIGITLAAIVGMGAFPHLLIPLAVFSSYQAMGGPVISYVNYVIVCWGEFFIITVLFLLANKFILKTNVIKLSVVNKEFFHSKVKKLNAYQKTLFSLFICMILSFLVCNMMPAEWPFVDIFRKASIGGLAAIFCGIAMIVKIEGKPLLDFQRMASDGILWAPIILMVAALAVSSAITAEGTGVQQFLLNVLGSFFAGKPDILFIILVMGLALVITNFANNLVTALIFMTVVISLAEQTGINATAMVVLLTVIVHIAVLTPAACPMAAVMFSNTEWIKPAFVYKQVMILMMIAVFVTCTYGYFVANMLF